MVAQMHFYTQSRQVQIQITMRAVCSEAGEDLDNLLERLDPLERTSTSGEMPARIVRSSASPACV
jgi:hypothetical protein